IEHKGSQDFPDGAGTGFIERDDLMSSVAFWYQIEPHTPWPPMPHGYDRLPFHDRDIVVGHNLLESATHSDDPIEIQPLDGVTDGKQLWFRPHATGAWLEVPFSVQTNETV